MLRRRATLNGQTLFNRIRYGNCPPPGPGPNRPLGRIAHNRRTNMYHEPSNMDPVSAEARLIQRAYWLTQAAAVLRCYMGVKQILARHSRRAHWGAVTYYGLIGYSERVPGSDGFFLALWAENVILIIGCGGLYSGGMYRWCGNDVMEAKRGSNGSSHPAGGVRAQPGRISRKLFRMT